MLVGGGLECGCGRVGGPPTLLVRCVALLLVWTAALASAPYYDPTAMDHQVAYRYLDEVEKVIGTEAFEAVPYELALQLALTLGNIDKFNLDAGGFVAHVREVCRAEQRYYKERPLGNDMVVPYVLPLRIRCESTSKPAWFAILAAHFQPLTAQATNADEAARLVLDWMATELELSDPAFSYKLVSRGELDPLTVLKGGRGNELDLAVFGVAALRASGVAARFVWAPALRGEVGGKAWLEYYGEKGKWLPWVPSFGKRANHAAVLREAMGGKIVFVMARPEAPVEITDSYAETLEIAFDTPPRDVELALMIVGSRELMPALGDLAAQIRNGRKIRLGKGPAIIGASFGNRTFALLPIDPPPGTKQVVIIARDGNLSLGEVSIK